MTTRNLPFINRRFILSTLGLLPLTLVGFSWEEADKPKMIDLGTLGGASSCASALNDHGQVVGSSSQARNSFDPHAFFWERGKMTDLGTLGGSQSEAYGINNRGQVVGWSYLAHNGASHAFLWEKGRMTDLGTLGGASSITWAINDRGQIVGSSNFQSGGTGDPDGDRYLRHAFLWENGKMTDLGTLHGWVSDAYSINDRGQIAGTDSNNDLFLWENGKMTELGNWPEGNTHVKINCRGQVVGESSKRHAFLWAKGDIADLGTLGGPESSAEGINNRGQVVGSSYISPGNYAVGHAFLWENGKITDLFERLSSGNSVARGINQRGDVVGCADTSAGYHAFLVKAKCRRHHVHHHDGIDHGDDANSDYEERSR